jgi:diacylglycerol kinase
VKELRNILIAITFLLLFIISIVNEPIDDVIDAIAGGTNSTYGLTVDSVAGVSANEEYDDDEDDD